MTTSNETGRHSPPVRSPKRQTHRRSASAAPNLGSILRPQTRTVHAPIPETAFPGQASDTATSITPRLSPRPASSYPKSASFAPSRQSRGRDWESWKQDDSIRLPEDVTTPWLRAPFIPSTAGLHRIEPRREVYVTSLLSFSNIQTIVCSPCEPTTRHHTDAPITLSSHSSATTRSMKLASKGTPSRSEIILPGSIPASKQDSISDLLPPPLDDEISYDGSNNGEDDDEPIPDGIPTHLKEKDEFKTKMRLILLRTLLTRCEVLLSIVHELERKPWAYDATKPPYYYYSKIRNFAYRARRLAEALESRDLQARCEYWAGRGCGGTRDWHAASQHFALAIKLDVENDTFPSGRTKKRALRPNEKEDVHFLLESVTRRHERWLRDTADARGAAQYESEFTGKRIEECINWDSMDSPTWLPERDRVVQIWKREGRTGKKKGGTVEDLGDDRECDDIEEKRKQDNKYEQDLTRREFSAQERHYILHGDSQTAKRKEKIKLKQPPKPILETSNPIPNPSINHSCKTQASTSSSLSSLNPSLTLSSSTNPTPTPPPPPTLEHELNQAGWTSLTPTPTPPLSYSTPSPPAVPLNLKERRNLTIQPIQTNYMRQQGDSGEAEQEHEPKSQGEMFDGIGYEYEYEYGNGGYGGYGGPRSAPPFRTRATDSPKGTPQSGATTPCTPLLSHQRGSPWSRRGREGRMQGVRAATMSARIGGMVGLGWVDENEEV